MFQLAYRWWLCSLLIPYFHQGATVPPCTHFCETVENRCPYFVPHADSQYAGEPSFLCRGNVPFILRTTKLSKYCEIKLWCHLAVILHIKNCNLCPALFNKNIFVSDASIRFKLGQKDTVVVTPRNEACYGPCVLQESHSDTVNQNLSSSDHSLCYINGTSQLPEMSTSVSAVSAGAVHSTVSSHAMSASSRTHIIVLAQLILWCTLTLILHRDIGLT